MINVKNKELIDKIQSLLDNLPVELTYDSKSKKFFGCCHVGGNIINCFYVAVNGNDCEILYECIEYKTRNNFIHWFNSHGGKEMFLKEYQKVSQTGK